MKTYDDTTKRRIVAEYAKWNGTRPDFLAKYAIPNSTLHQWIHIYGTQKQQEKKRDAARAIHIDRLRAKLDKAKTLINILQSSKFFSEATAHDKLEEMKRLSSKYSIRSLADAFGIPRGTYYNNTLRAKGENAWFRVRCRELTPEVIRIFTESHGAWGSETIANKLTLEGNGADVKTVAKIMLEQGLVSNRNTSGRQYANERRKLRNLILKEQSLFSASAPNKLWVSDVTELSFDRTKVHLCAIIDIFARKVVGYEIGKRNCTRLVIRALNKAIAVRNPGPDLVFHSDRGATNLSRRFMDYLRAHNIIQSASRPHVPQDNAVIESFFRSLKAESIYPCRYTSCKDMIRGVEKWLNAYNAERPHSYNRNKTPNQTETEFHAKSQANAPQSV